MRAGKPLGFPAQHLFQLEARGIRTIRCLLPCLPAPTLIKKKINFHHILENSEGSYMTDDLLIYGENNCVFPHILGSPYSYMTLHTIPSEILYTVYEENFVFFFISVPFTFLDKNCLFPSPPPFPTPKVCIVLF
jgi:hypothetical protein